ncbi:MAG: hypothetical protein COB02_16575 [Candidatus Cloacimonadota bacterium]|nr:MAG: hypothetical protein COB02_16575 [Candidatus Cloacimonadota bacterium]
MRTLTFLSLVLLLQFPVYCEANLFNNLYKYSIPEEDFNLQDDVLLYEIDFSKYKDGNATKILKQLGFSFKLDASKIKPVIKESRLFIGDKQGRVAFFVKNFTFGKATKMSITWGVSKFTNNEDWENNKQFNSLGLAVSFGTKKFSSGGPFYYPKMPRFIGYFISKTAKVNKRYLGKYYRKSGRLLCLSNSSNEVTSNINLVEDFEKHFEGIKYDPITGFAFQVFSKGSNGSLAYIKNIQFFGPSK